MPVPRARLKKIVRLVSVEKEVEKCIEKERIFKEGHLIKRGRNGRRWNQRWCVLRPQTLCIYKRRNEYPLKAIIHIENIKGVGHDETKRRPFVFGILTDINAFFFDAQNQDAMIEWMAEIRRARDQLLTNTIDDVSTIGTNENNNNTVLIPLPDLKNRPSSLPGTTEDTKAPSARTTSPRSPLGFGRPLEFPSGLPLVASPTLLQSPPLNLHSKAAKPAVRFDSATQLPEKDCGGSTTATFPPNVDLSPPKLSDLATLISRKTTLPVSRGERPRGSSSPSREKSLSIKRSSSLSPARPKLILKQRSVSSKVVPASYPAGAMSDMSVVSPEEPCTGLVASEVEDDQMPEEDLDVEDEKRREILSQLQQDQVLKSGYLLKQDRLKQWRKRSFVLRSNSLSYYPDDKEYVLAQIIPRSNLYDVRGPDPCTSKARSAKRGYLKVVTTQRNYWLASDEPFEAQLWLNALRDWQAGKLQPTSPENLISSTSVHQHRSGKQDLSVAKDLRSKDVLSPSDSTDQKHSPTSHSADPSQPQRSMQPIPAP